MDKRCTEREAVAELRDGMTIGIGGWGSRRKPMSIVRELLRSPVRDLTLVTYGGPDVGLLCKAGKVRRLVYGFVSLDSIPLEPHFRAVRQAGAIQEVRELDEGMLQWGLYAAALRLPHHRLDRGAFCGSRRRADDFERRQDVRLARCAPPRIRGALEVLGGPGAPQQPFALLTAQLERLPGQQLHQCQLQRLLPAGAARIAQHQQLGGRQLILWLGHCMLH